MTRCPLCNYETSADECVRVCSQCPLEPNCRHVCCPHCGYEQPPEAPVVTWVTRVARTLVARRTPGPRGGP